ncbi:acetoacetate decarboxylase family protein [Hyalangium sp.]|uniref:acetoacetate decarboxylase family protein n=1 Tax=Hyalangium sp. TaxID=2028555 RepID=UPI002D56CA7C|nr:acetoacetate decarboxylase family protein [Hyalangium sp.]HYH94666.1 acetoacetate decarboxylase family protein [Hyalangium sp.]
MQTPTPGPSLFEAYPRTEDYELSSGVVCQIPYTCHSADFVVLHGPADLEAVRRLMAGQRYQPVSVGGGKCAAALWIADYHDTSCGPYKELILSIPASLKSLEAPASAPMELLQAGALPEATIYCHKLILDKQVPIDFGREVHGHAKHPTPQPVDISFSAQGCRFDVACEGKRVVVGQVRLPEEPSPSVRASFGFVTPKEVFQTRNIMHFELESRFRLFGEGDEFSMSSESTLGKELVDMRFTPQVVQYLPKTRFVMPKPLNWRGAKEK